MATALRAPGVISWLEFLARRAAGGRRRHWHANSVKTSFCGSSRCKSRSMQPSRRPTRAQEFSSSYNHWPLCTANGGLQHQYVRTAEAMNAARLKCVALRSTATTQASRAPSLYTKCAGRHTPATRPPANRASASRKRGMRIQQHTTVAWTYFHEVPSRRYGRPKTRLDTECRIPCSRRTETRSQRFAQGTSDTPCPACRPVAERIYPSKSNEHPLNMDDGGY
jgi:hypothetical protein